MTALKPLIKFGVLNVNGVPFFIFGIFGKSSTMKALIKDSECFVDTFKLPPTTSSVIFLSLVMFDIKLYKTEPDTAIDPGLFTFTGNIISIPISRFVAFMIKVESLASNKTQLKIGRVIFLLVTLSAFPTAYESFSFIHSIFIPLEF